MSQQMTQRISATDAAVQLIQQLSEKYGALAFLQSGGCCEGSGPLCMPAAEYIPVTSDVLLGEVAGAKFYMSQSHFEFSRNTHTILDAIAGSGGSFSLECGSGMAFVTRGRLFTDEELKNLQD
jgi:uncharacterized protein (DUF779 family)